ncbi:MAG: arsenate reductase family protein [Micrococcales bacterium]|nr:arsenate reductase family protein [Micrococcales bacterium]
MEAQGLEYQYRDIKEEAPTHDELVAWHQLSGLPIRRWFNTNGGLYRSMELKDKLPTMSQEEQLRLLATDGMLVKRPLLVDQDLVLVGFKQAEWEAHLAG